MKSKHYGLIRAGWVVAVSAMLLVSCLAQAARTPGQAVSGVVKNSTGAALAGAKVTLTSEVNLKSRSTLTSDEGQFTFASVEPGSYTIAVTLKGFEPVERHHLVVSADKPVTVDFTLALIRSGAQGGSIHSPLTYDDNTPLKPSPAKGAVDAGGYSSPGEARTSYRILQGVVGMRKNTAGAGSSSASLNELEHAARTDPSEQNIFNYGSELLVRRSFDAAIETFAGGIARYPKSVSMQIGYGVALYSRGRYEEAIKALCAASDLQPADPRAYLILGKMYAVAAPNAGEVAARIERFVEAKPDNAQAHFYYAMSLWKGQGSPGDPAKSPEIEAQLKAAISLDSQFADAPFELGNLYLDQKRLSDSILEYKQAIKLQPDFADAHYRLAEAYSRAGNKALARQEFQIHDRIRERQSVEEER